MCFRCYLTFCYQSGNGAGSETDKLARTGSNWPETGLNWLEPALSNSASLLPRDAKFAIRNSRNNLLTQSYRHYTLKIHNELISNCSNSTMARISPYWVCPYSARPFQRVYSINHSNSTVIRLVKHLSENSHRSPVLLVQDFVFLLMIPLMARNSTRCNAMVSVIILKEDPPLSLFSYVSGLVLLDVVWQINGT